MDEPGNSNYWLFLFRSVSQKDDDKERRVQANGVHHAVSGEDEVQDGLLNGAADAEC